MLAAANDEQARHNHETRMTYFDRVHSEDVITTMKAQISMFQRSESVGAPRALSGRTAMADDVESGKGKKSAFRSKLNSISEKLAFSDGEGI